MQFARLVVPLVLGFVTTPALASPGAIGPDGTAKSIDDACEVRVLRAPEAVRAAIEARIGIESACVTLEVRVVPTRDGYYVIATQPGGETFDGTVRDASLVGELVLGWARMPATPAVEPEPPIVAAAAAPVVEVRARTVATENAKRDFTIGAHLNGTTFGLRGELDILASRGFSLGVGVGASGGTWTFAGGDFEPMTELTFRDVRGVIIAAKTFTSGPWRLRAQAGIGFIHTTYSGSFEQSAIEGDGTTRMFELAIAGSRDLGSRWALSIGPVLTYYDQQYELPDGTATSRLYDIAAFGAIRRRL